MARRTRQEQAAATRELLIETATPLFVDPGYDSVSLDQVARAADVTKGAVYHHFENKRALFAATIERLIARAEVVFRSVLDGTSDPFDGLQALLQAFLTMFSEPALRRVTLIDAPAVLGWDAWRELQMSTFLGLLVEQLRAADSIRPLDTPPELLAPVLAAIALESGVQITSADGSQDVRAAVESMAQRILDAMVPRPPA